VEVAAHCTPEDCWVVVDGRVYDVTSFLRQHLGGAAALSRPGRAGTDVSEHFHRIGHSEEAKQKLESMHVMDVQMDEEAGQQQPPSPQAAAAPPAPSAPPAAHAAATCWVAKRDTTLPLAAALLTVQLPPPSSGQHGRGVRADGPCLVERNPVAAAALVAPPSARARPEDYAISWHGQRRRRILMAHPEIQELYGAVPWTARWLGLAVSGVHAAAAALAAGHAEHWAAVVGLAYAYYALTVHVWLCVAGYFLSVHGAPPTNRLAKSAALDTSVPVDAETSLTSIVDKSLPVIDSSAEGLCQPTTSTYSWSVSFYRDPNSHSNQLGWPTYLSHTAAWWIDGTVAHTGWPPRPPAA
jgi:hypothetical protein